MSQLLLVSGDWDHYLGMFLQVLNNRTSTSAMLGWTFCEQRHSQGFDFHGTVANEQRKSPCESYLSSFMAAILLVCGTTTSTDELVSLKRIMFGCFKENHVWPYKVLLYTLEEQYDAGTPSEILVPNMTQEQY